MTERNKSNIIGGNAKLVRNINRAMILNLIRERQPISRIEISRITKLNKSTVSSIVSELLEDEFLIEELVPDSKVGRNPLQLRLNTTHFSMGAINFDANIVRTALFDIGGNLLIKKESLPKRGNPQEYVQLALKDVDTLKKQLNISELEGIGVTISGLIDPENGHVIVAPNLGWKDVNLQQLFSEVDATIPFLRFFNDAKASALAELWFGQGPITGFSNFVFVSVGMGLGTGIVINRQVVEGAGHTAGEFGHIPIFDNGIPCTCGNKGCWEAYASDRATIKRYLQKKGHPTDGRPLLINDIIQAAHKGDSDAVKVLEETGEYLGIGISMIVRALDPQAVVIGGRILEVWDIIYDKILHGLAQRSFFGIEKQTQILPSSLKEHPRLIGAATLIVQHFFNDYKITL